MVFAHHRQSLAPTGLQFGGYSKAKFDFVDFNVEYNAIINKQNGGRERSLRNFTIYKYFLNFEEFLQNHHRNIVIVIISQKFGRGQY